MRANVKLALAGAVTAVALAAGSTAALAAVTGNLGGRGGGTTAPGPYAARAATSSCPVPSLPGAVADITLTDMGGPGAMAGGPGGMMGGRDGMMGRAGAGGSGYGMRGRMSVQVSPTTVSAGTVSLRVANEGSLTHELVVLPLAPGTEVGQRTIGSDGAVSEAGSLGEASSTCAGGEGDGIAAGSDGWVTLDLEPGRYELVCNLPGHYAAGMYAELDVSS